MIYYTHVYTGDGKGKSTAGAGLCLRMLASGQPVWVLRFLKGRRAGEDRLLEELGAKVLLLPADLPPWHRSLESLSADAATLLQALEHHPMDGGLVFCDEIVMALNKGVVSREQVEGLLDRFCGRVELLLTGRNAPLWLLDRCDYVTEMKAVAHPYTEGVAAREGVEF